MTMPYLKSRDILPGFASVNFNWRYFV